jgi:hypothetical protein
MRFVANLRQETIDAFSAQEIQPAAYLLSSHRVNESTLRAAATVRELNLPLFADNGTKPLISSTIELFDERATGVREAVKELRRKLGRMPRGKDIPDELRKHCSDLAGEVVKHATDVSDAIDLEELLEVQLSMKPTHLLAKEDFATACLIALDLERETTGWPISRFETRNRRCLKLWKRVADDPRCEGISVYAVLSAMDYNTARSAGRLAAGQGVPHAALGIAGITLDPSATDFFVLGTVSVALITPAPRRFVRLAQILRGLADGYADARGRLKSFHCLGLGASAMLPLAAAALGETTAVTADATSPIHDAVRDRVLYDPAEQGDRASTVEITERIVNGGDWPFLSPFTKAFREEFGHDPGKARSSWEDQGRPPITIELLGTPSDLTAALPLFSEAESAIRTIASKTHIAHNHWVLGEICEAFPDKAGRHERASAAIDAWLSRRTSISTARGLTAALQVLTEKS